MDKGILLFELPSDDAWGAMQTDPAKLNYLRVTTSGSASTSDVDIGDTYVRVMLDKCPPNGKITFTYGGGTGAKRGARVQDKTGVATFTIQSQGDEYGDLVATLGVIGRKPR